MSVERDPRYRQPHSYTIPTSTNQWWKKCPFPPHMLPDSVEFLQHCVLPTISMIISPCNQPLTYLIAPWIPHPFNCCFPVNAHYSLLHYYFIHKLFSLSPLNLPFELCAPAHVLQAHYALLMFLIPHLSVLCFSLTLFKSSQPFSRR